MRNSKGRLRVLNKHWISPAARRFGAGSPLAAKGVLCWRFAGIMYHADSEISVPASKKRTDGLQDGQRGNKLNGKLTLNKYIDHMSLEESKGILLDKSL